MIKTILITMVLSVLSMSAFAQDIQIKSISEQTEINNSSTRDLLIHAESYRANIDRFSSAVFASDIAGSDAARTAIRIAIVDDKSLVIIVQRQLTDAEITVLANYAGQTIREIYRTLN